ncbi:YecA family protein [Paenibacillus sp. YYML68]|uniref:YecA family protein n=1 Tax=Paenibacillus sp. YYML68 TaxID=2909250 RepID=UPI002493C267|nr:SEC-C metal-binding domain-containing protein [Paenibacillus sp. YYML68]
MKKADEKLWMELKQPLILEEQLVKLTKQELLSIRDNLGLKGSSALKKQELVDTIAAQLPEQLPRLLDKLDAVQYHILKKAATQDGLLEQQLDYQHIYYFKDRGLLFPGTIEGKRLAAMPKAVLDSFDEHDSEAYQAIVQANTRLVKLSHGMLYYYGTLSLFELEELLQQYDGLRGVGADWISVLFEAEEYGQQIELGAYGFSHALVQDPGIVKEEHRLRAELPFYPFTEEQLLEAGERGYVQRNGQFDAFTAFIRSRYALSDGDADSLVAECLNSIQNGELPGNLVLHLQQQLEMTDVATVQAFMGHLIALHNSCRHWGLKGYSPDEMNPARMVKESSTKVRGAESSDTSSSKVAVRPGRNEPCPCGSGKKYKKCCGS